MSIISRRFPIAPATLLLLAAPLGCGSDATSPPPAGAAGPMVRLAPRDPKPETAPQPGSGTTSREAGAQSQTAQTIREINQDVRRAAAAVEDGVGDVQSEVTQAVGEARGGMTRAMDEARNRVQEFTGAVRGEATQATATVEGGVRSAVDQVVGGVQSEVVGAQGDVQRRARTIQDGVKQSARGLRKNLVDGLFGPAEE